MRRLAILCLLAQPALAELPSPVGGRLSAEDSPGWRDIAMPDGPAGADAPRVISGKVERRAWRIPDSTATPAQLDAQLAERLRAQGFVERFSCETRACGGFDFRVALDLLGAPEMIVDLGDFRYSLMAHPVDGREVAIVTSRIGGDGMIHLTQVAPQGAPGGSEAATPVDDEPAEAEPSTAQPPAQAVEPDRPQDATPDGRAGDVIAQLLETGHVTLSEVTFESGSTRLGAGPFPDLARLAIWLEETPSARIVLVGHTDAVGSLAANRALSRARAEAVAQRVRDLAQVPAGQIAAEGAGWLAPVASNLTEEGRALNRRVEAVLLSM